MKLLTFRLDGQLLGVTLTAVKEINRNAVCTPVPSADERILGLYNMRGIVVTVFDLASILGYQPVSSGQTVDCVILKKQSEMSDMAGFAVDCAEDVIAVDETEIFPPPANTDERMRNNLKGVYALQDELLLIIEDQKIFQFRGVT